jgi:hypothetical protein
VLFTSVYIICGSGICCVFAYGITLSPEPHGSLCSFGSKCLYPPCKRGRFVASQPWQAPGQTSVHKCMARTGEPTGPTLSVGKHSTGSVGARGLVARNILRMKTANAWQSLMISPAWGAFNNIHGESRNTRRCCLRQFTSSAGRGFAVFSFMESHYPPNHTDPSVPSGTSVCTPRANGVGS